MSGTIASVLHTAVERFADHPAVVDGDLRISYASLRDRSRSVAKALLAEGVRPGDRVAICAPNGHEWIEAALGLATIGAVLVPVNTRYTGPEIVDLLERTRARAFVVAGTFLGVDRLNLVHQSAGGLPENVATVLRLPEWDSLAARGSGITDTELDVIGAEVTPQSPSDIFFTSGTSGRSKGAVSTHAQTLANAANWAELVGVTDTDRYLILSPFFHIFGYKAGILAALQRGATMYPAQTFDVVQAFDLIHRERISVLPGVPTIHQMMLDHPDREKYDLSSLRAATTGAATIPVVLIERMRDELRYDRVLTAYGLSEAPVVTMCRADDDPAVIATTSGRAVRDMQVRIADDGEILVRGPNVIAEYFEDPDATARAFDADGWFHTGDAGSMDEAGNLRITDRIKDMFTNGGFNVYPAEVEQVIARIEGVAESAVVGVPEPRLGEVGKAFVVLTGSRELTEDAVIAHCRESLANFKVPRSVEFVSELPRNATGKVLKRVLRGEPDPAPGEKNR
ncbi:AMP-dependent synthetase and ligase OS=Tsukamurella paurometabola (strain ATCC 8368 / DSM /CCUG 35730 / CIP 100753 / JCM 10117 / KCTC 9821 / NBRC 16120/ NCIMB 702349 / NCTC 13040) OX=521096 GN=Tpau_3836 PE=3 SV=1 [Tsukamurella paurometabola]|uniref:AMP-dependent synthetase and ligase n=1 Tax=Tsukamurella paurometabola (strain ATCC 8368 / DSM 20162 / CCUG 35730 / CIP 100753 / JCM 10117 / KCTC 9821 / NBRC 16120 / NCIMB 702349 / NCTC 13040) TaxID=521096 RepID=D5UYV8_TSUPD|nr:FadD3 family acyl-CoA ligase [Tsukamurella paurometabola]ADG80411.1 AMP-dependent synthetase and ligase [Tsukamurella paurometabola DSM 20162]SUP39536.1 Long-chain-fatty-acid--CoA ligase [Tsukamurella paurometabola]